MKRILFIGFLLLISLFLFAQQESLQGKKMGVIGDSYVRNHKQPVELTWHYKLAQKLGMEYLNYGRYGNCIALDRERFGEAMYTRYKEMNDSLDYIIVIAGHNDTDRIVEMGGMDVFKERLSILCQGLVEKYPEGKIYFFTRWITEDFSGSAAEKLVDAMIEVCGNYGIPIFDAARKGNIYAYNENFRKLFFQSPSDKAHLNAKGHDRFLPIAEKFVLSH